MNDIVLIGGGGHCKSVIDVIEQQGEYKIVGIVDQPELLGSSVLGYSIIGNDSDLPILAEKYKYAIVTVGQIESPSLRIKLYDLALKAGFILTNIISPRAYVSRYAKLGKGTIIMHDAVVNASVSIGRNCIINSKALVEHDSTIQDFCHVATAAVMNGGVIVHQGSFIGSGAILKQGIAIEKESVVSMGLSIKKNFNTNEVAK